MNYTVTKCKLWEKKYISACLNVFEVFIETSYLKRFLKYTL